MEKEIIGAWRHAFRLIGWEEGQELSPGIRPD
jgi:hypothetical protein